MKHKKLTILLILLLIAIAIFFCDRYWDKILLIKLDAEKIEAIEISPNNWDEDSYKNNTLTSETNAEEIAEIAKLFNESIKHHNKKTGTTHPTYVKVKYNNGNEISFFCGVGDFITVVRGKSQYNYVNGALDEYIQKMMDLPETVVPEIENPQKEERKVRYMDTEDCIDTMVPNPGEYMLSSRINEFLLLNLPDDQYLAYRIHYYIRP